MTSNRAAPTSQCFARGKILGRYLSLLNRVRKTTRFFSLQLKMYLVGDVLTTCSLSVSSKSCSQNFLIGKGRLLLQSVWSTHFPFIFLKKLLLILPLQRKGVTYFLRAVEMNGVASGLTVTE